MKKLLTIALFMLSLTAYAQNSRFDYIASTTTGTGQYIPLLVIPGTPVSFYTGCSSLPCSTKATTFTSASGSTCPSTAQVVLQLTNACVSSADSQGNFGGWFASGTYQYTETVAGTIYGPYNFTVGSGGGGSGTVNSGTAFGLAYYPSTSNAVSGDTPFNGIPFVSTSAPPVAAASANIASILQVSTGCNSAGYVYLPQSNTCVPVSGVTNLTATAPLNVSAATGSVNISAAKTGTDAKLVTAVTAGANGNCVQWSSTGGVTDSGNPCSGAGGINQLTGDVLVGPGSGSLVATVNGLQGNPIATTPPVLNAVPNWNGSIYQISQLTLDQIGPAFTINSFTCSTCGAYELGFTVASPTNFTSSYSSPATSASVTDGTNVDTLISPFTSGTLAFSYACSSTTTFTLTAIAATTKTATGKINCLPRSFGGTGTGASATGATASGTTAVLVGATGTLASGGLSNSSVGQVYNTTTSATQYVYLLLVTNVSNPTAGSFTTPGPAVFPMNTPTTITFTNQYGSSVTMYLYRSVNSFFTGTNNIITVGP